MLKSKRSNFKTPLLSHTDNSQNRLKPPQMETKVVMQTSGGRKKLAGKIRATGHKSHNNNDWFVSPDKPEHLMKQASQIEEAAQSNAPIKKQCTNSFPKNWESSDESSILSSSADNDDKLNSTIDSEYDDLRFVFPPSKDDKKKHKVVLQDDNDDDDDDEDDSLFFDPSSEMAIENFGIELSQPSVVLTKIERLLWLRERRNVGLWVQCNGCDKWRYLENVKDPTELDDEWYCKDNPDKQMNRCEATETRLKPYEEIDLIYNKYNAGSIVWARVEGYPWWPAMVDDDPDVEQYYWLKGYSSIPSYYHVTFFDTNRVERSWLPPSRIKSFKAFRPRLNRKDLALYGERISYAKAEANKALRLQLIDRLRVYAFLNRWMELENVDESNKTVKSGQKQKQ